MHSVEIELVGLKGAEKRREKKNSERNIYNAFDWAQNNLNSELTNEYILEVGMRVEPESNQFGYRKEDKKIQGSWKLPPSWEKVEKEMDCFLFENSCIDEPLEKAIHAHLHIARIHPFNDGNGRTARLIQNAILEKNNYLPILTSRTERKVYIDLIEEAVIAYSLAKAKTEDSQEYLQLREHLEKKELSLKEIGLCKRLALKLAIKRSEPKVQRFYNYFAKKEIIQLRNLCDKILMEKK